MENLEQYIQEYLNRVPNLSETAREWAIKAFFESLMDYFNVHGIHRQLSREAVYTLLNNIFRTQPMDPHQKKPIPPAAQNTLAKNLFNPRINYQIGAPFNSPNKFAKFINNEGYRGHIYITGATGSGKTATFLLAIAKNKLVVPPEVHLCLGVVYDSTTRKQYYDALCYSHMTDQILNKLDQTAPQVYFHDSLMGALQAITNSNNNNKKLLILDDAYSHTVSSTKALPSLNGFISVAKNKNTQVVLFWHFATENKKILDYFDYIILCNVNEKETIYRSIAKENDNRIKKVLDNTTLNPRYKSILVDKKNNNIFYWPYLDYPEITIL